MNITQFAKLLTVCLGIPFLLNSCSEQSLVAPEDDTEATPQGTYLTLQASNGNHSDTRLALDDLVMYWEDGDQLLLVDVDGQNPNVEMVTSLSEPSRTATFKSTDIVRPGTYKAVYIGPFTDTNWDKTYSIPSTTAPQGSDMRLESDPFTITDGQTNVSIQLHHVFCQLDITYEGFEDTFYHIGIVSDNETTPHKMNWNGQEIIDYNDYTYRIDYENHNNRFTVSLLIFPKNYQSGKIYFYASGSPIYEFEKSGKELIAGTKYHISLKKSEAKEIAISNEEIYTADQLRALNYITINHIKLMRDIDLSSSGIKRPIQTGYRQGINIDGNGKTLEGLTMDCYTDHVGLFDYCAWFSVNDLTIKDFSVKGNDHVGCLIGSSRISATINNCTLTGTNSIQGNNYVGGFMGSCTIMEATDIHIDEGTHVSATNYAGGVAGAITKHYAEVSFKLKKIESAATIEGVSSIGGIIGDCYQSSPGPDSNEVIYIANTGDIQATGSCIGGIFGSYYSTTPINRSYNTGHITGLERVGGICGFMGGSASECFNKGNILASTKGGGIAGQINLLSIRNSYSLGNIASTTDDWDYINGIAGYGEYYNITNCYAAGEFGSDGRIGSGDTDVTITNCLSTPDCTDFQANLSVINGDNAYSTTSIWDIDKYPYKCPLLLWQVSSFEGGTDTPGWAEDIW